MDLTPDELDPTSETFWDNSTGVGVRKFYIEDQESPNDQPRAVSRASKPGYATATDRNENPEMTSRKPATTNPSVRKKTFGNIASNTSSKRDNTPWGMDDTHQNQGKYTESWRSSGATPVINNKISPSPRPRNQYSHNSQAQRKSTKHHMGRNGATSNGKWAGDMTPCWANKPTQYPSQNDNSRKHWSNHHCIQETASQSKNNRNKPRAEDRTNWWIPKPSSRIQKPYQTSLGLVLPKNNFFYNFNNNNLQELTEIISEPMERRRMPSNNCSSHQRNSNWW